MSKEEIRRDVPEVGKNLEGKTEEQVLREMYNGGGEKVVGGMDRPIAGEKELCSIVNDLIILKNTLEKNILEMYNLMHVARKVGEAFDMVSRALEVRREEDGKIIHVDCQKYGGKGNV